VWQPILRNAAEEFSGSVASVSPSGAPSTPPDELQPALWSSSDRPRAHCYTCSKKSVYDLRKAKAGKELTLQAELLVSTSDHICNRCMNRQQSFKKDLLKKRSMYNQYLDYYISRVQVDLFRVATFRVYAPWEGEARYWKEPDYEPLPPERGEYRSTMDRSLREIKAVREKKKTLKKYHERGRDQYEHRRELVLKHAKKKADEKKARRSAKLPMIVQLSSVADDRDESRRKVCLFCEAHPPYGMKTIENRRRCTAQGPGGLSVCRFREYYRLECERCHRLGLDDGDFADECIERMGYDLYEVISIYDLAPEPALSAVEGALGCTIVYPSHKVRSLNSPIQLDHTPKKMEEGKSADSKHVLDREMEEQKPPPKTTNGDRKKKKERRRPKPASSRVLGDSGPSHVPLDLTKPYEPVARGKVGW